MEGQFVIDGLWFRAVVSMEAMVVVVVVNERDRSFKQLKMKLLARFRNPGFRSKLQIIERMVFERRVNRIRFL
jgi:mannitol-1-phosphate/altronate dehydrogenase